MKKWPAFSRRPFFIGSHTLTHELEALFGPVSYTHLDVYKRQIFYLSAKRLDFRQTADYNMAKISPAGRSSSGHILEDNYGLFNG